jgi:diguanylate cyclase
MQWWKAPHRHPRVRARLTWAGAQARKHGVLGLCLLLLFAALATNAVRPLDTALSAWRTQVVQRSASGQVVVVEMDSASLHAAGEWPWPRARFARAIETLHAAGAEIIALDIDFSLRADGADDTALQAAIDARPQSVVLPAFMQPDGAVNQPLANFQTNALLGSVNIPVDDDGRVRRYAYAYDHGDGALATLAALGAGRSNANGSFLIDYGVRLDSIPHVSFEDVIQGRFDPALVRGRVVIVGATALELGDEFSTPVDPALPGVYVHALATESLILGRALSALSAPAQLAIAILVLALLWPRRDRMATRAAYVKNAAVLGALLAAPLASQALVPVSIDLGLALFAQGLCVLVAVIRALAHRAEALRCAREAGLRHAALYDAETGLANRRAMLEHLCALPDDARFAVLVVGVERLATLRAAIGFTRANAAVAQLAHTLSHQQALASAYHLSTSVLGFVVLLDADASALCLPARHSVIVDQDEFDLDIRTGLARAEAGDDPETVLEHAVEALNHARAVNVRAVTFDHGLFCEPRLQMAITSDVTRALKRGDFSLAYQPKVSARTGGLLGLEALLRWRHPDLGDIPPARFIAAAEETGAIEELTRFVVNQALVDQKQLRRAGVNVPIAVNFSGRSLVSPAFCESIIDKMSHLAQHFCIEITETAVITDPDAALAALDAFRRAGIKLSIDDYGAGLSSLAYLKQISADELKLDRALVVGARTSQRDRLILKSTIDLAHGLGMQVVAEGVEDEETCAILSTLGCDALQGYAIMRGSPLEEITVKYGVSCRASVAQ